MVGGVSSSGDAHVLAATALAPAVTDVCGSQRVGCRHHPSFGLSILPLIGGCACRHRVERVVRAATGSVVKGVVGDRRVAVRVSQQGRAGHSARHPAQRRSARPLAVATAAAFPQ